MTSSEGPESPFYIGSIYGGVDNSRRRSLMESFDAHPVRGPYCGECGYDRICGGCAANNYLATGSVNGPPEVFCWWRRLLLAEAGKTEEVG